MNRLRLGHSTFRSATGPRSQRVERGEHYDQPNGILADERAADRDRPRSAGIARVMHDPSFSHD